ncbi:MAG: hypothetical protein M3041_18440 [Acidobacteriota bacterium]|nr:hypothetical protein [Acidobacteriota bacterium]
MHAHEEFLGQSLLPLEKASQDQQVDAADEMDLRVIAGSEDRFDHLDLHHLEMTVDRQQQSIISGERIVAAHKL